MTGTMRDNSAMVIVPTTTNQTIATGYHDGTGYVEGDADLLAHNIKDGIALFGVTGIFTATSTALVPRTGLTTSVVPGDDGYWQMGMPWPNPRFTDNGDGTVTDNTTGLIWLKDANCYGPRKWSQAIAAANGLAAFYCGLGDGSSAGDWRLPNVRELLSLLHYGVYEPALPNTSGTGKWTDGDPFVGVVSSAYYWTSSDLLVNPLAARCVDMANGLSGGCTKESNFYVWPVRGGQ
jgi:hypothetical protein